MRLRSRFLVSLAASLFLAVTIAQRAPQDRQATKISQGHAIIRALYGPDQKIHVMGIVTFGSGGTYQDDGVTSHQQ